ncbi:DNA methyltransferase [Croceibacter atlanticus]|uniref:Adenine-specific DNA modification methyltransferase n=1 Tax=Croceibacter atlanticus (strain ATCC BAA-628 / JCM 21780 / CIP 108009 / IAM 15332 / KCTC 12090 / HTCC2559) TaxID=216432 RepID=A3U4K5_CROAH|nr:DNA methyltransferase [Croceibacter atlanticus]EAP87172.1 adenine-specific DNA modification methyltransferase [Croceibacter atlanticus HTCC2559]
MIDLKKWDDFKIRPPFKEAPFNKRNWGNKQHSLCSFYGKLKPAISHHLVDTFSSEGDNVFDCFTGSGTIPFEASLNNRKSYALDINPISITLTTAKIQNQSKEGCTKIFDELVDYLAQTNVLDDQLALAQDFGFNKSLIEYYHEETLKEICIARKFFMTYANKDANYHYVLSALLHILHGNRPYALSRRSHSITPYSPTGIYEYKSLTEKLYEKMSRSFLEVKSDNFIEGNVYEQDILEPWNDEINNIDAIITSPPFFDSTRFYLVHWLRSWFLGWEKNDFDIKKQNFVGEKQKKNFQLYDSIFQQSKERLSKNGVVVFHLGKSKKKNMGQELEALAKSYFKNIELFDEDVTLLEKHGIKDKGTVSAHQYLVMY